MRLYHRTPTGQVIVENGFVDHHGTYLTDRQWEGVWVSDRPLDENEGAKGDDLVVVEVPEQEIVDFEWVQEGAPYREWLVPASVLNRFPRRLVDS